MEHQFSFSIVRALANVPISLAQAFPFILLAFIVWKVLARRIKIPRAQILSRRVLKILFFLLPSVWIFIVPFVTGGGHRGSLPRTTSSQWIYFAPVASTLLECFLGCLFISFHMAAQGTTSVRSCLFLYECVSDIGRGDHFKPIAYLAYTLNLDSVSKPPLSPHSQIDSDQPGRRSLSECVSVHRIASLKCPKLARKIALRALSCSSMFVAAGSLFLSAVFTTTRTAASEFRERRIIWMAMLNRADLGGDSLSRNHTVSVRMIGHD